MSSPRKEYFLGEHGPRLGVPLVMGVGGAIDVVAGVTRRAPVLWQRLGLEWLYRLLQEPRRMFAPLRAYEHALPLVRGPRVAADQPARRLKTGRRSRRERGPIDPRMA